MRRVYALLRLAGKYGAERTDEACRVALDADMLDVYRLRRMLESVPVPPTPQRSTTAPTARFLRPSKQYALNFRPQEVSRETRTDLA
jgi:hypothetical protein